MSPDEAAHVLAELEEETSSEILDELTEESKSEVSELIEYREHTAGALMNTEYVALPRDRHRAGCDRSATPERRTARSH